MPARLPIIKPAKRIPILLAIPILFFTSCGERTKTSVAGPAQNASLDNLYGEYYQSKKRINPLEAAKAGVSIYNDQPANYIPDDYQQYLIANHTHFLEELKRFRDTEITTTQRLSKGVMGCSLSGPRKITKTGSTGPSIPVYVYAENERGHGKGSSIAKDFIKSGTASKPG